MMAHQDNFDHRSMIDSNNAQDPTSMTIEFLRARLLAERAVSKSARAKLHGLADKVAELEEQLKIVSLQRKKAEQATADVLSILEENGFTDLSDAYDSNSDQESYSLSNSMSGKNISWKGRRKEPGSSDKIMDSRNRRHRGFDSSYSSSRRHRQGRSCRQIRRNESRTTSDDYKSAVNPVYFQENANLTENPPQTSEEAPKPVIVDVTVVKRDESLKKKSNEKENSVDTNLERALKTRAQVIGSFGEMEETQKEWEKKFKEDQLSALELYDVGNHSDLTDESNGEKSQTQLQGSTVDPSLSHTKSIANEVDLKESFETLSSRGSLDNSVISPDKCCISCGSKSMELESSPSGDNEKHISESPKSESSHPQSYKGTPVTQPNSRGGSFSSNATAIHNVDYPVVSVAKECDSVLTALKQAKLSLQEKVNILHIRKPEYRYESSYPSTPGSYMNTYTLPIEPAFSTTSSIPASSIGPTVEFPVGCAGLFRVPTDFSPDASRRNNSLASSSHKALVSHVPERDIALVSQMLDITSPPVSMNDRLLTTPYIGGPKLWTGFREDSQPMVDAQDSRLYKGSPSVSGSAISGLDNNQVFSTSFNSGRQVSTYNPMTPTQSFYPDSVLRSRELYSTPYYTRPVGLPPTGGSDDGLFRRV